MRWWAVGLFLLVMLPVAAYGQVYRCAGNVFQGSPCADGGEQLNIPSTLKSGMSQPDQWRAQQERAAQIEARRLRWQPVNTERLNAPLMREQIEMALRLSLHDPASLEIVRWGVFESNGSGYRIDVAYRATNMIGARVLTRQRYHFDSNQVIERGETLD